MRQNVQSLCSETSAFIDMHKPRPSSGYPTHAQMADQRPILEQPITGTPDPDPQWVDATVTEEPRAAECQP